MADQGASKDMDISSNSSESEVTSMEASPLTQKSDKETVESNHSTAGAEGMENAIDKLLQKQRNELMYELRRLQHGDRPVTGQGNKEAVEQFFQQSLQENPTEPEINRPEHVLVEVNALVERRPVSSALQRGGFRRNLENALRGAIQNIGRRTVSTPRQPVPRPTNDLNLEQAQSSVTSSRTSSQVPQPRDVLRNALQARRQAIDGSPVPAPRRRTPVSATNSTDTDRNVAAAPTPPNPQNSFAEAWLNREQQNNFNAGSPVHIWDTIEQAHREELIADISELVHRQLVTETLHGNFRNTLERRMQERLVSSNTDGQRVQEFVQSLPRTHMHVRNDFSDLGITQDMIAEQVQEALSHSDEMSVVSATAAVTVPYAQSNAAMSRELMALKAQLQEMKNMMKLQFDLTMDVQRSIRQEVAAAMHQTEASQQVPTNIRSRPVSDTHCLICLDGKVDTVLYQCGHMCVCHGCGMNLRQRGSNCPVCRAPIKDIIRAYKCNSD